MEKNTYVGRKIDTLKDDQRIFYNMMQRNNKLQICVPTGFGKGYLMFIDLLNQIVNTNNSIFCISTHRLLLNNQHLDDAFNILLPIVGDVGFIFVGSSTYHYDKYQNNVEVNKQLLDRNLSYSDLFFSSSSTKDINNQLLIHQLNNRKVVIISTYHSLNKIKNIQLNTIYSDESHQLAAQEEQTLFKMNFESIKYERCFFFTATPKDCIDENTNAFLMNNENIFGERVGLSFKESVNKGYVVKPVVHISSPDNYNENVIYYSLSNITKFVIDSYNKHKELVKLNSTNPDLINPKLLIKCSSVDEMWNIHNMLCIMLPNVNIFSGASRNSNSNNNYYHNNTPIKNRNIYLNTLQNLTDLDEAIVLHFDTMSEGINISGFTGVMFLSNKLPTITKTLQNIGRATRLHKSDRINLNSGNINVDNLTNWVKPYCYVILPYWGRESLATTRELSNKIRLLRDNFYFDPTYYISIGDDVALGTDSNDNIDPLNLKNPRRDLSEIINGIVHHIENLDEIEKVNKMDNLEFFNYNFGDL